MIDHQPAVQQLVRSALEPTGLHVECVDKVKAFLVLVSRAFDAAIAVGDSDVEDTRLVDAIWKQQPHLPIVFIGGSRPGAGPYPLTRSLQVPFEAEDLRNTVLELIGHSPDQNLSVSPEVATPWPDDEADARRYRSLLAQREAAVERLRKISGPSDDDRVKYQRDKLSRDIDEANRRILALSHLQRLLD